MNKSFLFFGSICVAGALILPSCWTGCRANRAQDGWREVHTIHDVQAMLRCNLAHVNKLMDDLAQFVPEQVQKIIKVPDNQRCFANTARVLDEINRHVLITKSVFTVLKDVSPDPDVQAYVEKNIVILQELRQTHINKNVLLFNAFKAYVNGNAQKENLTPERQYFLSETMRTFERAGLGLSTEKRAQLQKLEKELTQIMVQFDSNIAHGAQKLLFTKQELDGVADSILARLKQNSSGQYIVGLDYPTYEPVMTSAYNEQTRKRMFEAFESRAYPANYELLKRMMALRDSIARLLGFVNFAEYDLANQMAKTPKNVYEFFEKISGAVHAKRAREFKRITAQLPEHVQLTRDGKLKPWDVAYTIETYLEKCCSFDSARVAEYFPVTHTVNKMCELFGQFFGVTIEWFSEPGFWHDSVTYLTVRDAQNKALLGYIILDLYPRENKYTHIEMQDTILPQRRADGTLVPGVAVIIANFQKPSGEIPGLLTPTDVNSLFHEFGHAMHHVLSATELASTCGVTNTKVDFVEFPSQLFELWLSDSTIVCELSSHYKTHEQLPEDLAHTFVRPDMADSGYGPLFRFIIARLALELFSTPSGDVQTVLRGVLERVRPHVLFDENSHMAARLVYLTEYGAKAYTYLWTRAFAHDVFTQIKQAGLKNPVIGKKLVQDILGKGSSADPNDMLRKFLSREPSEKAYVQYLIRESA